VLAAWTGTESRILDWGAVDSGLEKKYFPKKKAAAKPRATAATSSSPSLRFRFAVLHELMVVSLSQITMNEGSGFSVQVSASMFLFPETATLTPDTLRFVIWNS
jgi:hypothetical protein